MQKRESSDAKNRAAPATSTGPRERPSGMRGIPPPRRPVAADRSSGGPTRDVVHLGVARGRTDDVAPDAVLAVLERRHLRQPAQRELGRRVRDRRRHAGDGIDRADVDDAPVPRAAQERETRPGAEERADRVDAQDPFEDVERRVVDGRQMQDGGVVHEDVECVERPDDTFPVDLGRHIEVLVLEAEPGPIVPDVRRDHAGAFLGEEPRDLGPRPAGGTRDERCASVESSGHRSRWRVIARARPSGTRGSRTVTIRIPSQSASG